MIRLTTHHSYEELRGVVIDILLNKEPIKYGPRNYDYLLDGVGQVLVRRKEPSVNEPMYNGPDDVRMDSRDVELVRDVFWDLFRQGYITLGRDNTPNWPWFRLSHHAEKTLGVESPYRFHDAGSFVLLVRQQVPGVLDLSVTYLEEAVATFYSGCLLASCVMVGVAAEVEFLNLLKVGKGNPQHAAVFERADKERQLRHKIEKFQNGIHQLPKEVVGGDFQTHLNAIQSILRIARNDAGHALGGGAPSRENVYIYLQLFVPFAAQLSRIRKALA